MNKVDDDAPSRISSVTIWALIAVGVTTWAVGIVGLVLIITR